MALRRLLMILSLGNRERAIKIAMNLFRPILHLFIGKENVKDRARVADLLVHPNEKPVSLYTALQWFEEGNIELLGSSPSCRVSDYPVVNRLFGGRSSRLANLFIQLRWMRFNADYYVIAGQVRGRTGAAK